MSPYTFLSVYLSMYDVLGWSLHYAYTFALCVHLYMHVNRPQASRILRETRLNLLSLSLSSVFSLSLSLCLAFSRSLRRCRICLRTQEQVYTSLLAARAPCHYIIKVPTTILPSLLHLAVVGRPTHRMSTPCLPRDNAPILITRLTSSYVFRDSPKRRNDIRAT